MGDTIICPDADTTVVSVSSKGPVVQIDGTDETACIPAFSSFYRDDLCLLHRDRPQRQRRQRVLYNATVLGGTPEKKARQEVDTGEDLVGKSFYACVDDGDASPSHYIITGVGDPEVYADLYKGPVPPYLRYLRSDEMDDPNAIPRDSTTKEIREWMKSHQGQAEIFASVNPLAPVDLCTKSVQSLRNQTELELDGNIFDPTPKICQTSQIRIEKS